MISLVNKTFFVTGLGSGIGYETGKLIKSLGGNLTGTIENEDQKKDILSLTEDIFLLDLKLLHLTSFYSKSNLFRFFFCQLLEEPFCKGDSIHQ